MDRVCMSKQSQYVFRILHESKMVENFRLLQATPQLILWKRLCYCDHEWLPHSQFYYLNNNKILLRPWRLLMSRIHFTCWSTLGSLAKSTCMAQHVQNRPGAWLLHCCTWLELGELVLRRSLPSLYLCVHANLTTELLGSCMLVWRPFPFLQSVPRS